MTTTFRIEGGQGTAPAGRAGPPGWMEWMLTQRQGVSNKNPGAPARPVGLSALIVAPGLS